MSFTFLLLALLVIIAILGLLKAKSQGNSSGHGIWPFYAKKPLSPPEQILYFRLLEALPDYIILAQVQLSRFLGVKKGHNYQSWSNRINRMSADFVICKKDASIVAVIELDDSTHQKLDRHIADNKKDKALEAAAIKVVRWQAKSMPDLSEIKATFIAQTTL
ncbi:DUF2726 domain-containing protein [Methylophilus sp. QUAN]|uniref:DUF2726 domain-containing protein n=1 Tax=unclassified Methylophilus TaxID=2630143 RepID=UPI001890068B|nr:DUF2726 domain-containing protein [Methylophilus sp. QUAN]MBF4991342.1 DUF2726 domain-containing protein [Methylophilus sp. QUAN]